MADRQPTKRCPRCHSQTLVPLCGGGVECLSCDYQEGEDLSLYAEMMAAVPGAPLTGGERHDEEMSRVWGSRRNHQKQLADDLRLAEEAALRHGVYLEDIEVNMLAWKRIPLATRAAMQSVIQDLTINGLGVHRIARVLHKSTRTVSMSAGRARGLVIRKRG